MTQFSSQRQARENIVNLRLTDEQNQVLNAAAEAASVSRSELLRMALDLYLREHPITPEQPKPPKKSRKK